MRACDAKTEADLLKLKRDNFSVPEGWLLTSGDTVTVAAQRDGENASGIVRLPRAQFNRLIRDYQREQHAKK